MEFLNKNNIETTTSIVVESNTLSAENLLIRDPTFQYVSSGYADDLTTTTITFNFDQTTTLSRIALDGINLKAFDIYYNGLTANSFNLTSTSDTSTSQWSNNSNSSLLLKFSEINATSVSIDMKSTQVANSEKAVGYIALTDVLLTLDRIPSSKNYKPIYKPTEILHRLSDGGSRLFKVANKYETQIKYKYISKSFRDNLKTVYDLGDSFLFHAFGTTTGWDGVIFEVVWSGSFNFYEFSDNAQGSGFSGIIKLSEIS